MMGAGISHLEPSTPRAGSDRASNFTRLGRVATRGSWKTRARVGLLLAPLAGALGSCGGTASSTRHEQTAGAAAGPSDGPSKAGASAAAGMGHGGAAASSVGAAASSAGTAGASTGGGGTTSSEGIPDGGAADAGPTAGAGGESNCVDVCALHGPSCCVAACVTAEAACVIDVFDVRLSTSPYEYAQLEQTVASLSQSFVASLSTADIEWAGADPPLASRFEMRLSPAASALYGAALESAEKHPFRLSCGGQSLFVGQVYMLEGAAALDTPVLDVSRDADDAVILRLGAQQGAWAFASAASLVARERLDQPQFRATLCLAGALAEL